MLRRLAMIMVAVWLVVGAGCSDGHHPVKTALDLDGEPIDPLAVEAEVVVLLFTRTDCPISNRYAPEVRRIQEQFAARGVAFWLIYPDPDTTAAEIRKHMGEYRYAGPAAIDPYHRLVGLTGSTITPEVAVFGPKREMRYRGRIDDRYVDFGKSRPVATRHDLEDALTAVLAGDRVAEPRTKAIGCFITDLSSASQ